VRREAENGKEREKGDEQAGVRRSPKLAMATTAPAKVAKAVRMTVRVQRGGEQGRQRSKRKGRM
jgi:hypothetical protein